MTKPASSDASFRRYFRVQGDVSCIVMDAPPQQEDCRPFVQIADYLEKMGLNGPRVLKADLERGFLLLSDLGSLPYLTAIERDSGRAAALYMDAIDALLVMQTKGIAVQGELPLYDDALLRFEISLFHDWLCERHLGISFSRVEEKQWQDCCDALVDNALNQPRVFVHRDYHSRNLMVTGFNNPGILDFQDAVEGPLTYDLVSLLKDCYIKWPVEQVLQWALYFRECSGIAAQRDRDQFLREFSLTGVHRHLKAAGIFARLLHRDNKPGYLKDVPRTLGYIVDIAPRYEALHFLGEFVKHRVLPALSERS
jgi:aminoglycoside/choline kinase family phosphotransferase